jgi:hypothetical protein
MVLFGDNFRWTTRVTLVDLKNGKTVGLKKQCWVNLGVLRAVLGFELWFIAADLRYS